MKVFVDTNVLLDVLARRQPFYVASAAIWTLAETGKVQGFASALSLPNMFYILRKEKGQKIAKRTMSILRDIFTLVPLDAQIINQAVDSSIADFEDAIQFFSANRVDADVLVSRNCGDFPQTQMAVQTPDELLASRF